MKQSDKKFNLSDINKALVGLGNVDNKSSSTLLAEAKAELSSIEQTVDTKTVYVDVATGEKYIIYIDSGEIKTKKVV